MNVEFYFDPSCPFCWVTSRWLLMVSGHRSITIDWKPFSLALKNDELTQRDDEGQHANLHRASHRVLRVFAKASELHGIKLIDLYTSSGIKHHVAGFEMNNEHIAEVLTDNNLPKNLLAYADDTSIDSDLSTSLAQATAIAGQDIGVPTIIFQNKAGDKQGFFGPVLQELPDLDEALDLWDGLSKLATNSSFYELKRSRPSGGPDVFSTAKC
ncbi:disulfide bond formation protein DsbA [Candidatus Saccharibacteria bacterium]|jgi:predicted DsbA family dithiol-disulfide isomerase|nr:disulfide bond formation protein DsbA [Candidatus Saccharibacteria bacterium]